MRKYIIDLLKSSLKWTIFWIWIFLWLLTVFAVNWPSITPSWEITGGAFMNYFNKILVNTWATTDWTVKKSESLWLNGSSAVITISWWLASISGVPVWNNDIANKAYVDAAVSAAGGGWLNVYKYDWVTVVWNFLWIRDVTDLSYLNVTWNDIIYSDTLWNIGSIDPRHRTTSIGYVYFTDAACTSAERVSPNFNNNNWTYFGWYAYRSKADWLYYIHKTSNTVDWGYSNIYRWDFATSTCVLVWTSKDLSYYKLPAWKELKICQAWDCKIK